MLCGHAPYHNLVNETAVIVAITEGVRPEKPEDAAHLGFTEVLWNTVEQCWLEDSSARPGVEDILFCLNGAPLPRSGIRRATVRKAIAALLGDSQ